MENYKKKYEKAFERANAKIETYNRLGNASMVKSICDIFPELKESEDERVRKALIHYFSEQDGILTAINGSVSVRDILAWLEKQGEQKPTDKVKPKFKVKYAGSEYNVLDEVKDIAGVTFYGIEDEPNHIDYVNAGNCEIISGYTIKENGLPYPTKPVVFSRQNPAWKPSGEQIEVLYKYAEQNNHDGSVLTSLYRDLKKLK